MKKIKELRLKLNITQAELAKKLELPPSTLFNYETGRAEPNINVLVKMADFYNVSVDELIGRESETLNLKYLGEDESYLIKKILKMNDLELAKTKAYVMGLME